MTKLPLLGMAAMLASGCTLMRVREQSLLADTAGVIDGTVVVQSPQKGPVVLVRLQRKEGVLVVQDRVPLPPDGHYHLAVLPGDYVVAAFIDVNNSGVFDAGEHGYYHPGPRVFSVQACERVTVPPMTISGDLPAPPADMKLAADLVLHTQNAGKITTLEDPVFSPENCAMGMWQPLEFLGRVGGGLFMLGEYRSDRMPVIFVHGMGGGPNDWRAAIERIDRERFQPWVFFYPSGIRLDMVSDALVRQVRTLNARHGFTKFGVVAHSMGGLVTRSFVKKYTEQSSGDATGLAFVMTVNSPMAGLASASSGVEHSPIVLPAWRDVAIASEFLKDLYAWSWPGDVPYHLVFSYQTGEGGDGTIPLESQIPLGLQGEATRVYGFNDSHVGTLANPHFLETFHRILAREAHRVDKAASPASKGARSEPRPPKGMH